ncbi:uncharacterized protein LOC126562483 [Anopheles maculipalpis]|uniref:uncharacterized protein LOC126562483 n=1 Tax=Anopheles maculipalpis TaxID=1496333 RepID=UPI00215945FE|nr:uncharacterized protein LOC126562483 [Anopheles maculipalpis]
MVQYSLIVLILAFYGACGIGYDRYELVRSGICHERRNSLLSQIESFIDPKKQVKTMIDFASGSVYEQSWNSSSFKRYSECKFTIQPNPGYGLYLSIRKMNLRRDEKGNCIDYVSVKQSNNRKTKFCYTPKDVPRSFSDPNYLKITIKLDHSATLPVADDPLHIQMVATLHTECTGKKNQLQCERHVLHSCIHRSFVNDGTINCPNCIDEPSCDLEPVEIFVASNTREKLVLTGFVSLFATAFLFCTCFLCLYKSRQCAQTCGSSTSNSSNSLGSATRGNAATRAGGRGRAHHGRGNVVAGVHSVELRGSSNDLRPSAPALEEKDLPPSYDALFPTTAVASSTSTGPTTVSTATSPTIPKAGVDREVVDPTK